MEEKITVLRKAEGRMPMIKKIKIGDPLYFERGTGLNHTYYKTFRGKNDWETFIEVCENEIECTVDDDSTETMKFKDLSIKLYLTYDKKMMQLIKANKLYNRQKTKVTELGVDTASYILGANNDEVIIRTGGDGSIGYACEYFTRTRMEALVVEVTLPCEDDRDFDNNKRLVESLFNCSLKEVSINEVSV